MNDNKRVFIRNGEFVVKMYKDEMDSFMAKAKQKADKYNSMTRKESPYGFNHEHSHLVGMLAEHASWCLFSFIEEQSNTDLGIEPIYQDETRDSECDIVVLGKRIEVKGIKYFSWKNFGPCVSKQQAFSIKKKADLVMWVLFNEVKRELTFKGFNFVSDIERNEPVLTGKEGKKRLNYKIDMNCIHSMMNILDSEVQNA